MPKDPLTGADYTYKDTGSGVGQVNTTASGNDDNGMSFASY